ncbi:MAG: SDR family NAD(P)-dependent oxidoreductase [Cyanobacteria bacterium J06582_2]
MFGLGDRVSELTAAEKETVATEFLIDQTEYTQPLLFTIEYALAQLWLSWGIVPDVMMGHSLGEYVAATVAEVFSLENALRLVVARSQLMQNLPSNGGMLAVFGDRSKIKDLIGDLSIAADNGTHLVLSGLTSDIERVSDRLNAIGIKTKLLNVSQAFHSPLMQPMLADFAAVAAGINYSLPQIPLVSNLTGELAPEAIATAEYWQEHIIQSVQFASSIAYLDRQQVDIFLEIGTKPTLIALAKSIIPDKLFLTSLDPQKADWQHILTALAQLYRLGAEIDWHVVSKNYNAKKTLLPTYPFQRQRYWFDPPQQQNHFQPAKADPTHPLLGTKIASPLKQTIWQSFLSTTNPNWLSDHRVNEQIIFPGTAYLEMAIALGRSHYQSDRLLITDVAIDSPLVFEETSNIIEIQTIITPENSSTAWEIYSHQQNLKSDRWQLHCQGAISALTTPLAGKTLNELKTKLSSDELDIQQHYQACRQKGLNYGSSFQGIKQLWANNSEALGAIELPRDLDRQSYHFHPALLDACLQLLFAALPAELQTTTYVPVGLDKLSIQSLPKQQVWSYLQLHQPDSSDRLLSADVWLYDPAGKLLATIKGLRSQAVKSQPIRSNWLYQPQWQPQPLLTPASLSQDNNWLIFAERNHKNSVGEELAALLKSQQQQYRLISRNDINDSPQAFRQLIQQHQDVTGVVYLWSLDEAENWHECQSYLYLVQALIAANCNPTLWYVTRHAQPVNNFPLTPGIKNSCLWGMQKAIALEHPDLPCMGIDLDSKENAAAAIFEEISRTAVEQVAYRDRRRYVNRLVKYDSEYQLKAEKELNQQQNQNSRLEINHPGDLDSLTWTSIPRSQPQAHEIEIEVRATGLNFRDVMVALDLYPDETKFLGLEAAGVVTQVGKDVSNFKPGDEVMAISDKSFSQYLVVDSKLAIAKPAVSFSAAATIPVTFLTAYYTLVYLAKLQPGDKILIHAAAGGVGIAAVQIAQQIGAEIYATASIPKWQLLESLGVKQIMNSRSLDFAAEIMTATQGKGVDVVLNSLAGEYIPQSISVLQPQGRMIEIGKQGIWSQEQVAAVRGDLSYFVVDLWQITQDKPQLIQQMLSELRSQFVSTELQPLPHKIFSSDRAIDAFRYMQQGKHQGKIVIAAETQVDRAYQRQSLSSNTYRGTYLITGGMGAIGLKVAQWLITKGITNLALLGRGEVKPELKPALKKIQENAQVNLIKADIADTNQLAQALRQIELELPPLKGVIHCAGITGDRTIVQQDWQSFKSVLAPKVQGAWNLHQLTQKYDLDRFILFSSAASLLGSAGQANYCAANAFLDTLAHARRSTGLPAIAINWSAWQDTGLAANPQITQSLQQQGIDSIKPSEAIKILDRLLLNPPAQIGVIPMDWKVWQQSNSVTPYYENLVQAKVAPKTNLNYKQQLLNAISSQKESRLITQISQEVGKILGINKIEDIDLELGFAELGLDSLGSVELRNKLQSNYDLKLSQTIIFDYPTIRQLSQQLLSILFPQETLKDTKAEDQNADVAKLSETEAELSLLAELEELEL